MNCFSIFLKAKHFYLYESRHSMLKEYFKSKSKRYLVITMVLSLVLPMLAFSYSSFIYSSDDYRASEMYIGSLLYGIKINNESKNSITVPSGQSEHFIEITSLNNVPSYFKLMYKINPYISISYYDTYDSPNDKIDAYKTIKIVINNTYSSEVEVFFNISGGYITNELDDIVIKNGYKVLTDVYEKNNINVTSLFIDGERTQFLEDDVVYILSKYNCSNNELVMWNNDDQSFYISPLSGDTECDLYFNTIYEFDYNGEEQTFVIPKNGKYKLEVWGAQGADATATYIGGKGGYATGEINLEKGTTLYINIGGKGDKYTYSLNKAFIALGGYNGGGYGHVNSTDWVHRYLYAGGGATHIATESGLLSSFESTKENIIIVAGGGGSGSSQAVGSGTANGNYYSYTLGGSGGGYEGGDLILSSRYWTCGAQNNTSFYSTGGKQNSGGILVNCSTQNDTYSGSFGQGSISKSNVTSSIAIWGGGGGYYGGSLGAGGSGYIANTNLTNKVMYCYNCNESSEENIKTISTENYSSDPISNYAKLGNGYVRITNID